MLAQTIWPHRPSTGNAVFVLVGAAADGSSCREMAPRAGKTFLALGCLCAPGGKGICPGFCLGPQAPRANGSWSSQTEMVHRHCRNASRGSGCAREKKGALMARALG